MDLGSKEADVHCRRAGKTAGPFLSCAEIAANLKQCNKLPTDVRASLKMSQQLSVMEVVWNKPCICRRAAIITPARLHSPILSASPRQAPAVGALGIPGREIAGALGWAASS
jgi:hypothetical protein